LSQTTAFFWAGLNSKREAEKWKGKGKRFLSMIPSLISVLGPGGVETVVKEGRRKRKKEKKKKKRGGGTSR